MTYLPNKYDVIQNQDFTPEADPYLNSLGTTFEHPRFIGFQGNTVSTVNNLVIDATFNDTSPVLGQWYNGTYLINPATGVVATKGDNITLGIIRAQKIIIRYLTGNGSQYLYAAMECTGTTGANEGLFYNTTFLKPSMLVATVGFSLPVKISFFSEYNVDTDVGTAPKLDKVFNFRCDDIDSFERLEVALSDVVSWDPYGLPTITTQPTHLRINGSGTSGTGIYLSMTNGSDNSLNLIWTRTGSGTGGQGVLDFDPAFTWYNQFFFVRTRVSNASSLSSNISYTVSGLTNIQFKNISTPVPVIVTTFTQADIDSRLIIGELTDGVSFAAFDLVLADTRLGITGPSVRYDYAVPSNYVDIDPSISAYVASSTAISRYGAYFDANATSSGGVTETFRWLQGTFIALAGNTSDFTLAANNTITYTGANTKTFDCWFTCTPIVTSNDRTVHIVAIKNPATIPIDLPATPPILPTGYIAGSRVVEISRTNIEDTTTVSGQFAVSLVTNDTIRFYVSNMENNDPVTIADFRLLIRQM